MARWRAWLSQAPVVVVGLVVGVGFGVLTFVVNVSTGIEPFGWPALVGAVIGALVFGALMGVYINFQRKRAGGTTMAQSVTGAVKAGKLPDTATAQEWGPLLERRRRQAKLNRWLSPVVFGLFSLLSVYLIFTDRTRVVLWVAALLFFLALAIASPIQSQRQLPKIDSLEQQLADGASTNPVPPDYRGDSASSSRDGV